MTISFRLPLEHIFCLLCDTGRIPNIYTTYGIKGFTVKSLYNSMQTEKPQKIYKVLWKMKLPAKIKIFLWLLLWKRILTKDNPKKRGWLGDHSCMFCAGDESIDHLFFGCSLAIFVWGMFEIAFDFVNIPTSLVDIGPWITQFQGIDLTIAKILLAAIFWTLWKTRNRACFDHILPYDPVGVVFHICHWIDFWGDLQKARERRMLLQGARLLSCMRDIQSGKRMDDSGKKN